MQKKILIALFIGIGFLHTTQAMDYVFIEKTKTKDYTSFSKYETNEKHEGTKTLASAKLRYNSSSMLHYSATEGSQPVDGWHKAWTIYKQLKEEYENAPSLDENSQEKNNPTTLKCISAPIKTQ